MTREEYERYAGMEVVYPWEVGVPISHHNIIILPEDTSLSYNMFFAVEGTIQNNAPY